MKMRRTAGSVLLALTALAALATPASAHSELVSSTPAEGAQLATAPGEIKLTFDEEVQLPPDPIKVEGRDGTQWQVGTASAAGPVVTVPVTPAGPAQTYTLTYKIVAKDGDNVTGSLHFTLTAPVAPSTTSSAAPTSGTLAPTTTAQAVPPAVSDAGFPTWAWILLAAVVLLAAIVAFLRLAKGRGSRQG